MIMNSTIDPSDRGFLYKALNTVKKTGKGTDKTTLSYNKIMINRIIWILTIINYICIGKRLMQYGLEEVFKYSDPANARAEVQGLQVDDEPFPGRVGQGRGCFRLHRP